MCLFASAQGFLKQGKFFNGRMSLLLKKMCVEFVFRNDIYFI
jgi:hypothetical protein